MVKQNIYQSLGTITNEKNDHAAEINRTIEISKKCP